jgi:hypothetical protein
MRRVALVGGVLTGCLYNPPIEVDHASVAMARGTSRDVMVSIDGEPSLTYVEWAIDDPSIASVTPALDGVHLRIGGDREGDTVVHVASHGQTIDIPTQVGPPAIVQIWIAPSSISAPVGGSVHLQASALDTVLHISDISHDARWTIGDPDIAALDTTGMMLRAVGQGETTLHVDYGVSSALAPISIFR